MPPIRLLVVNDSSLARQLISKMLSSESDIDTLLMASHGQQALRQLSREHVDLVLLDVEMPVMNGLETLQELRREHPKLPVLMLSRHTQVGASMSVEVLLKGATDYLAFPDQAARDPEIQGAFKRELLDKIHRLVSGKSTTRPLTPPAGHYDYVGLLAIGSSTGGPRVLEKLLSLLPAPLAVPVLIVQHIAADFVDTLVESLTRKTGHLVQVARAGAVLRPGEVWVAPNDQHLVVSQRDGKRILQLNHAPPENSCRPSVDVLLRSVAQHYGATALAVVLTGMGSDGLNGARQVHEQGGHVLVQDQASSVIWGMPGAIAQAGLAEGILPPEELAQEILRRLRHGKNPA
ncbi:MAG: chemotaxis-specific protein-glutamate methyltransferase CheB [Candidatus Sericytochromatia bacterium]